MPLCLNLLCAAEIQSGLIGVGLISVEDRSGALSLDKGGNDLTSSVFVTGERRVDPAAVCRLQQHREVPEPDPGHGGPPAERSVPVLLRHAGRRHPGSQEERAIRHGHSG